MIDFINNDIAIGNSLEARDPVQLTSAGIRSVLCVDGCLVGVSPASLGVAAIDVVTLDDGDGTDLRMLERAVAALGRLVRDHAPVFVHCHAGRSRSPTVVAGHFMETQGIDADAAVLAVAARREMNVTPSLLALLRKLER